jgi:hypothetical protein
MPPSAYCLRGEASTRFGYFESSDLDAGVSSANNAKRGVFPEPTFGSPWRIGARLPGSGPPSACAECAFNGLSEYATATSERRFAGLDEALGAACAHTVYEFERTRPENERLGFVGALGIFVYEADE